MAIAYQDKERLNMLREAAFIARDIVQKVRGDRRYMGLISQAEELEQAIRRACKEEMEKPSLDGGSEMDTLDEAIEYLSNNPTGYVDYGMAPVKAQDRRRSAATDSQLKQMSRDADRHERERQLGIQIMNRFNPHYRNKK